jgi:hypothetical protein
MEYLGNIDEFKISNSNTFNYLDDDTVKLVNENDCKLNTLFFLNLENDTFIPVLQLDDKYTSVVKEWYDKCDILFDIEKTNIEFDNNICEYELSKLLFNTFTFEHKQDIITNYIPTILKSIIINKKIKQMEKTLCLLKPEINEINLKRNVTLDCLEIIIPNNMTTEQPVLKNSLKIDNDMCNKIEEGYFDWERLSNSEKDEDYIIQNVNSIIKCYNTGYNCLKPSFAETCLQLNSKNDLDDFTNIMVILNPTFLKTLVIINPDTIVLDIIHNHQEYGFIKLFNLSKINDTEVMEIIELINKYYDNVSFNDITEINTTLKFTEEYIELLKKTKPNKVSSVNENSSVNEDPYIKDYLQKYVKKCSDINNKIKVSTFYELIFNSSVYSIVNSKNTKNIVLQYLKDIGATKKRYYDGYYYHGIELNKDIYNLKGFFRVKGISV